MTADYDISDLESRIMAFGSEIFKAVGEEQPSTFNKNYLPGRLMEWSMTKPLFKLNMFRLVDVLPSLKTSSSIARHVSEYLAQPAGEIHGLLSWGLRGNPRSIKSALTAMSVKTSVKQMAKMFIAGETAADALSTIRNLRRRNLAFTVDLLGEYSLSEKEAQEYLDRYLDALEVLGSKVPSWPESKPIIENHRGESSPVNVSVKLSALYSQCNALNFKKSVELLSSRLTELARKARRFKALLNVDAEDTAHNPIIYETFKTVFGSSEFKDFPLPGIVVQSYLKDADQILADLIDFARARQNPLMIRLVKGAYWDYETVVASQNGWPSPLYSLKPHSDACYEELSRTLIDNHQHCFPAFASHNIRSLAHACCYAEQQGLDKSHFELQMLHGMAEPIALAFSKKGYLVRLYVPLGQMLPGMGYLVRRLLENTSNESFLRHTFFDENEAAQLLQRPASFSERTSADLSE